MNIWIKSRIATVYDKLYRNFTLDGGKRHTKQIIRSTPPAPISLSFLAFSLLSKKCKQHNKIPIYRVKNSAVPWSLSPFSFISQPESDSPSMILVRSVLYALSFSSEQLKPTILCKYISSLFVWHPPSSQLPAYGFHPNSAAICSVLFRLPGTLFDPISNK